MKKLLFYTIFTLLLVHYKYVNNEINEFEPSSEWKVIKPGQPVPRGIHVRHDFKTGLTEGKLMDETNSNSEFNDLVPVVKSSLEINHHPSIDQSHKKMNIKFDASNKFRTYRELKEDLARLNLTITTDGEIMDSLIEEYFTPISLERKLIILEDLDYYLHKVDNAINFASNGKIKMLMKDLFNSDPRIKSGILSCLASSVQGNIKVKISVLENGLLSHLGRIIKEEISPTTKPNLNVLLRSFLTLGAILRQFPYAQHVFFTSDKSQLNSTGFHLLNEITSSPLWLSTDSESIKLRLRVFTLIGDLIIERVEITAIGESNEIIEEKRRQYSHFNLTAALRENNWCRRSIMALLDENMLTTHDNREKLIISTSNIINYCSHNDIYSTPTDSILLADILDKLIREYSNLAKKENVDDDDEYFSSMLRLVLSLREQVFGKFVEKVQRHSEF